MRVFNCVCISVSSLVYGYKSVVLNRRLSMAAGYGGEEEKGCDGGGVDCFGCSAVAAVCGGDGKQGRCV